MTDICSIWAYHEIRESGLLGKRQAQFIFIFVRERRALTVREVVTMIDREFGETFSLNGIGSRISELTDMGYLEKYDHVLENGKRVNRWIWTGAKRPFPKRIVAKQCSRCEGIGTIRVEEYYDPEPQGELF